MEQIGQREPAPPEASPVDPAPRGEAPRTLGPDDLVELVLCAVANQTDTTPRAWRGLLHTAFKRAREVGLTLEAAEAALAKAEEGATSAAGVDPRAPGSGGA